MTAPWRMPLVDHTTERTQYSYSDYSPLFDFTKSFSFNEKESYDGTSAATIAKAMKEIEELLPTNRTVEILPRALSPKNPEWTDEQPPPGPDEVDYSHIIYLNIEKTLKGLTFEHMGRFVDYILRLLRISTSQAATAPAHKDQYEALSYGETAHISKPFDIIPRMLENKLVPEALHTMVVIKAFVSEGNKDIGHLNAHHAHTMLDLAIKKIMQWTKSTRHKDDYGVELYQRDPCLEDVWCFPSQGLSFAQWSFASSARVLRVVYMSRICRGDKIDVKLNEHVPPEIPVTLPLRVWVFRPCFHTDSIKLLDWLQKSAWAEIRTKMQLTIGKTEPSLPPELFDMIFQYALGAEEIPSEPSVASEEPGDDEDDPSPLLPRKLTKKVYFCGELDPRRKICWVFIDGDIESDVEDSEE